MRIQKLELHNFRCFEHYELNLADRFTLLIGDNGSGKTAVLEGTVAAVCTFLSGLPNIPTGDRNYNLSNDKRYEYTELGQTSIKESTYSTTVSASVSFDRKNDSYHCLERRRSVKTGRTTTTITSLHKTNDVINNRHIFAVSNIASFQYLIDKNHLLPLLAYYDTGRLWKITSTEIDTLSPDSRLVGYRKWRTGSNLKNFLRWFKTQELISLQNQKDIHALEAVREAIVSMIPDCQNVRWDMKCNELFIKIEEKDIPFRLLSDGYRNMIGMVADIAYRMATLNPQLEKNVIKQTEGIVLIDEIDLHLHPNWQRIIVERLLNTFPKVQFVATTHSPFIIQSLYHRQDCLLWDLDNNQPLEVTSKSIEDIAEDQQGVEIPQQSSRFLDMEKAAEKYYRVLKQIPPASEQEKQLLKRRLDELLFPFSDDPAFQAFLKMERLAVEGQQDA